MKKNVQIDRPWGAHFLKAYSTGSLKMLHDAVRQAQIDDPSNVAENGDFEVWAELIESELDSRDEAYEVITFQ